MNKRVLFYFNSNSTFYTNLFYSIKKGFEECGCAIEGAPKLLSSEELNKKIQAFKPDFVLEINRAKSEIPNFPEEVIHICWLFDLWDKNPHDLYSDIVYTFGYTWLKRFPKTCAKLIDCLPPATDNSIYKKLNVKKEYDFSFLGHIPKPWSNDELNRIVGYKNEQPILFKSIFNEITSILLASNNHLDLERFAKKHNFEFIPYLEQSLKYDITTRTFRQQNRLAYLKKAMSVSDNVVLYGTNWNLYDEYKAKYKGYLENPNEINYAIQTSKIMLHDNHNLHFRILDAMANGTPVMLPKPRETDNKLSLFGLEKEKHYFEIDVLGETPLTMPSDKALQEVSKQANALIESKHLWKHRVETILKNNLILRND